ncbi:unnamed protein product [Didymodactylos carnosus]|uniref:Uncharacterized protein n=1 Tax=Didymodactylos carnosus TaxID=1234261 RepID=A0A8S2CXR4_9BILA|nr:unnamed protein product [Didymodactylos carnosus]CAF3615809.1 unnamed protein product [Didymodactylos carnosus]
MAPRRGSRKLSDLQLCLKHEFEQMIKKTREAKQMLIKASKMEELDKNDRLNLHNQIDDYKLKMMGKLDQIHDIFDSMYDDRFEDFYQQALDEKKKKNEEYMNVLRRSPTFNSLSHHFTITSSSEEEEEDTSKLKIIFKSKQQKSTSSTPSRPSLYSETTTPNTSTASTPVIKFKETVNWALTTIKKRGPKKTGISFKRSFSEPEQVVKHALKHVRHRFEEDDDDDITWKPQMKTAATGAKPVIKRPTINIDDIENETSDIEEPQNEQDEDLLWKRRAKQIRANDVSEEPTIQLFEKMMNGTQNGIHCRTESLEEERDILEDIVDKKEDGPDLCDIQPDTTIDIQPEKMKTMINEISNQRSSSPPLIPLEIFLIQEEILNMITTAEEQPASKISSQMSSKLIINDDAKIAMTPPPAPPPPVVKTPRPSILTATPPPEKMKKPSILTAIPPPKSSILTATPPPKVAPAAPISTIPVSQPKPPPPPPPTATTTTASSITFEKSPEKSPSISVEKPNPSSQQTNTQQFSQPSSQQPFSQQSDSQTQSFSQSVHSPSVQSQPPPGYNNPYRVFLTDPSTKTTIFNSPVKPQQQTRRGGARRGLSRQQSSQR